MRAARILEHQAYVYKRFWLGPVLAYILGPLLFLAAMGFGVGALIDEQGDVDGLRYVVFVAPGLMAASAMQGGVGASLWPVLGGLKWVRSFHAMVATPVRPEDVYVGVVASTGVRAAGGTAVFVVIAAALDAIPSWWGVLAIPFAALCALAFAAPTAAFAATQETDARFPLVMRLGVMPLFLFSAVFFPLDQLPSWLQGLAVISPLWHGVELCRGATTGTLEVASACGHIIVLVAFVVAGWRWGRRTFVRRLAS